MAQRTCGTSVGEFEPSEVDGLGENVFMSMGTLNRAVLVFLATLVGCASLTPTMPSVVVDVSPHEKLIQDLANRRNIRQAVRSLKEALPESRGILMRNRESHDPLIQKVCIGLLENPQTDYEWYASSGLISLDLQEEQWWRWLRESGCGNAIRDAEFALNTLKLLSSDETGIYDSKHDRFILAVPANGRHWEVVSVVCSDPMSHWKTRIHTRMDGKKGPAALLSLIEYVEEIGGDLSLEHPGELRVQTKSDGFSHWSADSRALWRPDVANGPTTLVLDVLNNWEWLRISDLEFINLEDIEASR